MVNMSLYLRNPTGGYNGHLSRAGCLCIYCLFIIHLFISDHLLGLEKDGLLIH